MTLMNITMIIFSVVETVFKNFMFKYLHQILCILMHILMLLKLDNSSDCVDTSGKCERQRSTSQVPGKNQCLLFVVLNVLCDARDVDCHCHIACPPR